MRVSTARTLRPRATGLRPRDPYPTADVWLECLETRAEPERVRAWAGAAFVRDAVRRAPASWEAIDGVLAHASAEVRRGALLVLAAVWTQHEVRGLSSRIALALLDPDESVWATAERAREQAWRARRALDLDDAVVAQLVAALQAPEGLQRVGGVLADFVASSRARAEHVQALVACAAPLPQSPLAPLARACRARLLEAAGGRCATCRAFRRSEGVHTGWRPERTPEFECLRELGARGPGRSLRRCPSCGTAYLYYFAAAHHPVDRWETHALRRLTIAETQGLLDGEERLRFEQELPQVLEHEIDRLLHLDPEVRREAAWRLARWHLDRRDLESLDLLLLSHPDGSVRLQALRAFSRNGDVSLLAQTPAGVEALLGLSSAFKALDLRVLEPRLRTLAGECYPEQRAEASLLLALHLLRTGRQVQVEQLLTGDDEASKASALAAIHAAACDGVDVASLLPGLRRMLAGADGLRRQRIEWILGLGP